ncbi:MFS transporter [Streptomyces sp. NPDC004270]
MPYRSLLRVAGVGFFPLGFLARLPYASAALATLVLLQSSTHSYAFAGLASATQSIATALGGPLLGTLADRHGHRRVGVLAALANIAAWAGLLAASHGTRAAMLAAAGLVGLTQPQVGPLVRVHWSRLIHRRGEHRLLPAALSYEAAADELSFVAGPALVGVLAMAAMGAVFGAVQTAVTVYADTIGETGAAGLVYAEFGMGSALAGAACAWLPRRFTLRARYVTFAAALFVGMLLLYAGAHVLPLPAAVPVASVTVAPYMITLYTLTERLAPAERAATAMTVLCAGGPLGTAAGQAVSGALAEPYGTEGALLVALTAATGALLPAAGVSLRRRT